MECRNLPLLVVGNDKLSYSVSVCLLLAGHAVTLVADNIDLAKKKINGHLVDLRNSASKEHKEQGSLEIVNPTETMPDTIFLLLEISDIWI